MIWNAIPFSLAGLCLAANFVPLAVLTDEAKRGRWDGRSATACIGMIAMAAVLLLLVEF